MPSTTSTNKGLELQANGENDSTWGTKTNANLNILDRNLGGRNNKSVAGSSNVTLTTTEAQSLYQNYTGVLTGNIDVIFPATLGGIYIIKNATTGSFTLTVKPSGGTGVEIPQGESKIVFIDPDQTSAVFASPFIVSGGGLEFSSGQLRRSALTGDVTAAAGSNALTLGVVTTRGDIIYRNATVPARLAIGAANTVLASDGTDPAYSTVSALLDAVLGNTNGMIANRAGGVWTGTALATLLGSTVLYPGTEDQTISGGARVTPKDLGNLSGSTITPDPGDRPMQKITNNGAGTIAPGSNVGNYLLSVLNTSGAGAITTSGWTKVDGSFDTTTTSKFQCVCIVTADYSYMNIVKIA